VEEVRVMVGIVVLAFLALIGPLAYFYGVDSRRLRDRGWMAGPRR
jgi:hypothetical protein